MQIKVLIVGYITAFIILIYTVFHSSEQWSENDFNESKVYEKDFPYLNSEDRIIDALSEVQYAAIVYPTKSRVYPNSLFHKHILENPKESTSYSVQARVLYTVVGEHMNAITYGSSGGGTGSSAMFIGLCDSEHGFYAPGNGYEFPATQEAIEFVKTLDIKNIEASKSPACNN